MYGSTAAALTRRYDEEQYLKAYIVYFIQDVRVHALVGCVPIVHVGSRPILPHQVFPL